MTTLLELIEVSAIFLKDHKPFYLPVILHIKEFRLDASSYDKQFDISCSKFKLFHFSITQQIHY